MRFSQQRDTNYGFNPGLLLHAWIAAFTLIPSSANLIIEASRIPFLVWTSSHSELRITGLYSAPALIENQQVVMGRVATDKIASLQYPHELASLSNNDVTKEITTVDIGRGNIVTFNMPDRSLVRHHGGVSGKATGVAVDWSNGNIYWADEGRHWIVASKWNLNRIARVVADVMVPQGIALYSRRGLLFWSQVKQPGCKVNGQIMRSTMSGKGAKSIFESTGSPSALVIDYVLDKLYWIDSSTNSVFSVDVNGWDAPKAIISRADSSFKGLAVYQDWLYVTDFERNEILMINKTCTSLQQTIAANSPYGVTVSGADAQPYFSGPCDIKNGGCQEFCFPQPPGNTRKCACGIGMKLAADGTSCFSERMENDFLVVVDSDMHWIFQISKDGEKYARLDLPGINIPVQVEFDAETKMVYWTDVGSRSVNSAKWDGTGAKVLAKDNVKQPTGLALDRLSGNLYWTDEGTGTINVVRVDGSHRRTLLSKNVQSPRALAIDPFRGKLWWSDWTTKTLEMASMDGSDRKVIVSEDLDWPNGIAIDYKGEKLYWCDAHSDAIYISNLDGSEKKIFKRFSRNIHLFGIAVDEDFVYWTDWNDRSITRVPKSEPKHRGESFGPRIFNKLCDIQNTVENRNISAIDQLKHPCRVGNGDCAGLCLPIPAESDFATNASSLDRICACGDQQKGSCSEPLILPDDTVPPSFNGTCPKNISIKTSTCQKAALVDYDVPTAIDDSGRVAITRKPNTLPPTYFPEGHHVQIYVVTDAAGNTAECKFYINVTVIRCPNVQQYVKKFKNIEVVNSTCGDAFGSKVDVSCANGTNIMITDHIKCNSDGKWEGHPVCYRPPSKPGPKRLENGGKHGRGAEAKTVLGVTSTTSKSAKPTEPSTAKTTVISTSPPEKERHTPFLRSRGMSTTTKTSTTSSAAPGSNAVSDEALKTKFRSVEVEVLYLAVPAVIVIIIIIATAIGYKCCRHRNLPILETMEKRMSFFNLKEEEGTRDTVIFNQDNIMQHQRRSQSFSVVEEPIYADVHRSAGETDDEICAISSPIRRQSLPVERIYSEPAAETANSSALTTISSLPTEGYGSIG